MDKNPNTKEAFPWISFTEQKEKIYSLSFIRREMAREASWEVNFYPSKSLRKPGNKIYGYLLTTISTDTMKYSLGLVYIPKTGKLCVVRADATGIYRVRSPK